MNENSVRNIRVSLPYIPTKATTAMPDRSAGLCCQNREFATTKPQARPRSKTAQPEPRSNTAKQHREATLHCQNREFNGKATTQTAKQTALPEPRFGNRKARTTKPGREARPHCHSREFEPQSQTILPEPRSQTALSETQSRSRKRPDTRSQTVEPEPQSHGPFFTRHLDPSSFDHVPLLLIRFMKTG